MASSSKPDENPPRLRFLPANPSALPIHDVQREPRLKLLIAANGPKDVAFAQQIAVRLSKESKVTIRVIVDDLTHRLTQEFHSQLNRSLRRTSHDTAKDIELAQRQAYELGEWADLLVLAPIDADHMAKMISGIADTLLLEVIRSWVVFLCFFLFFCLSFFLL